METKAKEEGAKEEVAKEEAVLDEADETGAPIMLSLYYGLWLRWLVEGFLKRELPFRRQ